jgi:DNA-binding NarL/FixJ family response regulator
VSRVGHLRVLQGIRKGLALTEIDPVPVRVVLAGDSVLMADGLACLLEGRTDVDVVDRANDPEGLSAMVVELDPDAVLISLRTHSPAAMMMIHSIRRLREEHPGLGIVIVSDRGNGFALELLRGGSARTAYLLDDQLPGIESVVITLREVISGQTVLDASVVDALVRRRDAVSIDHLTIRELEVLEQIARGLANRAVAAELQITVKAVENHVTAIFRKLDLTDRADIHQRVAAALTYVERTH